MFDFFMIGFLVRFGFEVQMSSAPAVPGQWGYPGELSPTGLMGQLPRGSLLTVRPENKRGVLLPVLWTDSTWLSGGTS